MISLQTTMKTTATKMMKMKMRMRMKTMMNKVTNQSKSLPVYLSEYSLIVQNASSNRSLREWGNS